MKLSDREKKILAACELAADLPITKMRKETGLRDHTIRYHLSNLRESGIVRRRAFINVYPLGYLDYALYFSIGSREPQKLINFLTKAREVSWVSQLGGDYQYGFSVCAKSFHEVVRFLDQLSAQFGEVFFEKSLSLRVSVTLFSRKYLLGDRSKVRKISFGDTGQQIEIDSKDRSILRAIEENGEASQREIARTLGIPHSTVESRITRLERSKVIVGYTYDVDSRKFGMQRFRLLVFAKGMSPDSGSALFSFAEKHPYVTYFIRCLGSWDFELGVEVERGEQVTSIVQEIYRQLGATLNTVKVLPLFGHLKLVNFPFAN